MGMRQRSHDYINELEATVHLFSDYLVAALGMIDIGEDRIRGSVEFLSERIYERLKKIEELNGADEKYMYVKALEGIEQFRKEKK